MKKIFTFLVAVVFSATLLQAQIAPPQAFSFKATIQGANGQTVVDKMIRLRISILQDDINGFPVYSEFFTPTTNHYSQVDVEIGQGNVLSGIFSSIDWSAYKYFLKIEVDIKGGTNYELLSATQLLSVPYALYAVKQVLQLLQTRLIRFINQVRLLEYNIAISMTGTLQSGMKLTARQSLPVLQQVVNIQIYLIYQSFPTA